MEILLIMAVFIGLMYFMMVVPQKKRAEQQRKMLDSLEPGSRVLLNSGIFGTIRARGEQQLVIGLAPGVEVTVLKQTVVRTANPDEEEFEYAEDQIAAAPVDSFVADSLEQAPATPVEGELTTGEDAPADAAQTGPPEQPSGTIYQAGGNAIYQPGSNEVSATDDAGERPQER